VWQFLWSVAAQTVYRLRVLILKFILCNCLLFRFVFVKTQHCWSTGHLYIAAKHGNAHATILIFTHYVSCAKAWISKLIHSITWHCINQYSLEKVPILHCYLASWQWLYKPYFIVGFFAVIICSSFCMAETRYSVNNKTLLLLFTANISLRLMPLSLPCRYNSITCRLIFAHTKLTAQWMLLTALMLFAFFAFFTARC